MSRTYTSLKEFKKQCRKNLPPLKNECYVVDIYEKAYNSKSMVKKDTGLVYNELFSEHQCPWDDNYPENPERYNCVMRRIAEYGLLDRCKKIESREADVEEILVKHDPEHVTLLKSTAGIENVKELETLASRYDSIYFNQKTYSAAMMAAGSCINLVKAVVEGTVQNGMAVVRPPGHHAMQNEFCGFCYFNNVAVAAQYALDQLNVKKILLVDWDVHHGQATQQMFYDDPRLLYFSIHRYENGNFWPCLRESNVDYIGEGSGRGFNVNIPLNQIGCGDADYLGIFYSVLLPIAYEYQPDLILVSAGYDAAVGCPEGRMNVTPACYAHMTGLLMSLAQGKVAVVLEGGYFPPSLSESVALTLGALLGDVCPPLQNFCEPTPSVRSSILDVIFMLRQEWQCFSHYRNSRDDGDPGTSVTEHDVMIFYRRGEDLIPPFPTRNYYIKNTPEQAQFYTNQLQKCSIGLNYHTTMQYKVGYCYDPSMLLHKSPSGNDYEKPERLETAIKMLEKFDILSRMTERKCRQATQNEILIIHSQKYVDKLKNMSKTVHNESDLKSVEGWVTVYMNEHSMDCAMLAAGSVIQMVDDVVGGIFTSAVAIVRPPGHHAEKDQAGGFCLFNNVAIAAKHAVHNRGLKRVMILDWDIHHGNGIQSSFIDDPNVLYMSLHRYDRGEFYPNSAHADFIQTGQAPARGLNINIAWNDDNMGDVDYMAAFLRVVIPVAYEFRPELLLISAGFDAAIGDPLGGYLVSPEAFGHFITLLKPVCSGKMVLVLEGGYNVNSVAYSLTMCCKALLGDPIPNLENLGRPNEEALHSIADTIRVHSNKWKHLQPEVLLSGSTEPFTFSPIVL